MNCTSRTRGVVNINNVTEISRVKGPSTREKRRMTAQNIDNKISKKEEEMD